MTGDGPAGDSGEHGPRAGGVKAERAVLERLDAAEPGPTLAGAGGGREATHGDSGRTSVLSYLFCPVRPPPSA